MVEVSGIEPLTSLHAMQALYQLSYTPKFGGESGTRTPDTRIMIPLL